MELVLGVDGALQFQGNEAVPLRHISLAAHLPDLMVFNPQLGADIPETFKPAAEGERPPVLIHLVAPQLDPVPISTGECGIVAVGDHIPGGKRELGVKGEVGVKDPVDRVTETNSTVPTAVPHGDPQVLPWAPELGVAN